MRGVYTAQIPIAGLAAAKTLLMMTIPTNRVFEILETHVSNETNETNEQLKITWQKITTLGSPVGTAITPRETEEGDQASAITTCIGNLTTEPTTYTANTEHDPDGVPSLTGYHKEPVPEARFYMSGGDSWGLRILTAPTAFDARVNVKFREIG
jgi:hypothetical protein